MNDVTVPFAGSIAEVPGEPHLVSFAGIVADKESLPPVEEQNTGKFYVIEGTPVMYMCNGKQYVEITAVPTMMRLDFKTGEFIVDAVPEEMVEHNVTPTKFTCAQCRTATNITDAMISIRWFTQGGQPYPVCSTCAKAEHEEAGCCTAEGNLCENSCEGCSCGHDEGGGCTSGN